MTWTADDVKVVVAVVLAVGTLGSGLATFVIKTLRREMHANREENARITGLVGAGVGRLEASAPLVLAHMAEFSEWKQSVNRRLDAHDREIDYIRRAAIKAGA